MPTTHIDKLRRLTSFPALVEYLRDELDWPIEVEDAAEITFEYEPDELGLDPKHAVKIESIKQIRPLVTGQPWGIFFIDFESKRLPVVVLRRILRALVPSSRRQDPNRPVWQMTDLLFISAQGEPGYRSISFAHFQQRPGRPPELRTFSWDSRETHFYYLQNFNLEALRWPPSTNPLVWRNQWSQAFTTEHRYVIDKSQELAREMARHARVVRELVDEVYALESDQDPLHRLYDSFKEILLHDLTPAGFADMVAQTVAYGLFSAATRGRDELTYDHMVELVPNTNPFLKDLLAELTERGGIDLEELGVGQLLDLLRRTDITAILHDFGRQSGSGREDPVIHFYELFLNEYDKTQRVQRGVFYTPDPVVSYIIRSVDYLLKTEFGLADGLADTTTNPDTGEPWVQILDPATGTGTFLAHVIDRIEQTVKAKPGVDWNRYVAEYLLPRLNGFELLMAPYAVAHMKLGLKLRQTGYNFASDERLRIYLSNALEEPVERHEILAMTGFLSKESNEAARVKRRTPITVVIGNPPYSGHSANQSEWIAGLLHGIDTDGNLVENYFQVDGQALGERNPKYLNDDYVKFIRFGQWRIAHTGTGILAFITNHGYLDNPTFRGMRQSLLVDFDEIYLLDLHGSTKKKEVTPEGRPDENVFDIMPGVAILLAVSRADLKKDFAKAYHANLWGVREYKYSQLLETDVSLTDWEQIIPSPPFYRFVPQNIKAKDEYLTGLKLTEVMPLHAYGFKAHRDHFAITFEKAEIQERISTMRRTQLSDQEFSIRYKLRDNRDWQLKNARQQLRADNKWQDAIILCDYRPFDHRWCYFSTVAMDYPRNELLAHVAWQDNLCLLSSRQQAIQGYRHCWVARHPANDCAISTTSREANHVFPLYRYTTPKNTEGTLFNTQETTREPNLARDFIQGVTHRLRLKFIEDNFGNLATTLGPEDIFHYIYALLHSPTYRSRYAEFLKIDFPRLPLTTDLELFRRLCRLGADLVALHLLEDDYAAASWNQVGANGHSPLQEPITPFVRRQTGAMVGSVSKSSAYDKGKVYLDTSQKARSSYFEGVPEAVWNFHIGGYQVCHKWLYDRRGAKDAPGRTLTPEDIEHYQRIVVALQETIRLMDEIDAVIEAHGGWPLVGSVAE